MPEVSSCYRQLKLEEVSEALKSCGPGWLDESIPALQYELAVKQELQSWREGRSVAPFTALIKCFQQIPAEFHSGSVLEVGASSCFNRAVLEARGFSLQYCGIDFSPAFQRLAGELWPSVTCDLGDARNLPYPYGSFDIVLSGSVILHVLEFEQVIKETARVAKHFAIIHRTPVWDGPLTYYLKEAYGCPCLEIRFNESELIEMLSNYGLGVILSIDIYPDEEGEVKNRSYVCQKGLFHHPV